MQAEDKVSYADKATSTLRDLKGQIEDLVNENNRLRCGSEAMLKRTIQEKEEEIKSL